MNSNAKSFPITLFENSGNHSSIIIPFNNSDAVHIESIILSHLIELSSRSENVSLVEKKVRNNTHKQLSCRASGPFSELWTTSTPFLTFHFVNEFHDLSIKGRGPTR